MVREQLSLDDLKSFDEAACNHIQAVLTALTAPDAPPGPSQYRFVIPNVLGKDVPLVTNGESAAVTRDNVKEFFDLALRYRLNEFNKHVRLAAVLQLRCCCCDPA